jgi:aspartyl-tRNA(Asn)/glutamyl-tRNA(Gln) amidotransferase subunit A
VKRLLSIYEAGQMVRRGDTSSAALVEECFERIRALEADFHAFISLDYERARGEAAELDHELETGRDRGPLHGIPVSVKDNIATAGFPTTFGSAIGRGFQSGGDAEVVRRLKAAGAVVVGKNNLHEFALGPTNANAVYGDVPNPWDLSRIPGGSSGGSAAAVALGEVFASLGSDSGGSVRMPAAMCGLVGLKPTHGRVSLRGLLGGAPSMDHIGPLTRGVRDAAYVHDAIAGYDPEDPESEPGPVPSVVAEIGKGVAGLRIGVVADQSMGAVRDEIVAAVKKSAAALAEAGAEVSFTTIDAVELAPYAAVAVAYPEVSAVHGEWIRHRRQDYAADIRPLIDLGQIFSASQYMLAQRSRRHLVRQLDLALEPFDVVAMPTTAVTAGRRDGVPEPLPGDAGTSTLFTLIRFTVLFNMTGYPALSIPCGLDQKGLPIGLQLAGRPDSEPLLMRVASALEAAQPWPPAPTPSTAERHET